jgi:chromosome segregation ATPase
MRHGLSYPLQAVKQLRNAELDVARAELARTEAEIQRSTQGIEALNGTMHELEDMLRLCQPGEALYMPRQRVGHAYLADLTQQLDAAKRELEQLLERRREQIADLKLKKQEVRKLDRHELGLQRKARIEMLRHAQREADDAWLLHGLHRSTAA